MRKLLAIGLAGLLGLAGAVLAMAREATGAASSEQARPPDQAVPAELTIDLAIAVVARGTMDAAMDRLAEPAPVRRSSPRASAWRRRAPTRRSRCCSSSGRAPRWTPR